MAFVAQTILFVALLLVFLVLTSLLHASHWLAALLSFLALVPLWICYLIWQARHPDKWPPWDEGLPPTSRMVNVFVPVGMVYVLLAVMYPVMNFARNRSLLRSTDTMSQANLKLMVYAFNGYLLDHDDHAPTPLDWPTLTNALRPYIKKEIDKEIDNESADDPVYKKNLSLGSCFTDPHSRSTYGINTHLGRRDLSTVINLSTRVVFFEMQPDSDGLRAVAFMDGSCRRISQLEWDTLRPTP